jgi:hypothetical protein
LLLSPLRFTSPVRLEHFQSDPLSFLLETKTFLISDMQEANNNHARKILT